MEQETIITEIEQLKNQLVSIDEQRLDILRTIGQKYYALINNADDALKYVIDYISIRHPYNHYNIDNNTAYFGSNCNNKDHFTAISSSFKQFCGRYFNIIKEEIDGNGCIITFERI